MSVVPVPDAGAPPDIAYTADALGRELSAGMTT